MNRLFFMLVVAGVAAASQATAGGARDAASAFACDPSRAPLGKSVGALGATAWCNDGATATAVVGGKPELRFTGGVCWRDSTGFYVDIGTTPGGTRRSASPAGFEILDNKPRAFAKDSVHLGKDGVIWDGAVVLKPKPGSGGKKGNWAGSGYRRVGGKLIPTKGSGSFSCNHIFTVPA